MRLPEHGCIPRLVTAFLLVTAVWVNIAKLDTHAVGKSRDQALVAAMDLAVRAGFGDVGLTDVAGLSARPVL